MSKIKYLVMGVNSDVLRSLVSTLVTGELPGELDMVACQGFAQAYKVGGAGQLVADMSFATLLSDLVNKERKRIAEESNGEKLIQEVVRGGLKVVPSEGV